MHVSCMTRYTQVDRAGFPEESRKTAVWSLMWMAEKRKDEMREKEDKERAE